MLRMPRHSTTSGMRHRIFDLQRAMIIVGQPACEWRASMITRREFAAGVVGMGALATAGNGVTVAQHNPRNNSLMHVGGDYHSILGGE